MKTLNNGNGGKGYDAVSGGLEIPGAIFRIGTYRKRLIQALDLIGAEFEGNIYVHPELLGNDGLDCQMPYRKGRGWPQSLPGEGRRL